MYLASKTPRRATNLWVASIPPTAVGGSFKLSLHRNATQKHTNTVRPSEYPRTAVGGCLQIQPTLTRCLITKPTRRVIRCLTNKSTRKEVAAERRSVPRSGAGWQAKVFGFGFLH